MGKMNRRDFLTTASCCTAAVGLAGMAQGNCTAGCNRIKFGICIGAYNEKLIREMAEIGYDFYDGSVAPFLMPDKDDATWAAQRAKILGGVLKPRSCNGFLPGTFRLTGPEETLTWDAALKYAETACRRADEVGLDNIVFGSGGARNVPSQFLAGGKREGFGLEQGRDQFIEFNRKLAARIADCKVRIVIEPLCPNESNIFNYVWQGEQLVKDVSSPRIKVLADMYHMAAGRESAQSIVDAGADLGHCHIAMPKTRYAPGLSEPGVISEYFAALKKISYTGGVSIEAGWKLPAGMTIRAAREKALSCMKQWAG